MKKLTTNISIRSQIYIAIILMIYSLFALRRFRYTGLFSIEGVSIGNDIFVFLFLYILLIISTKKIRINMKYWALSNCLLFVLLLGGIKSGFTSQYIYSVAIILVPMLFLFVFESCDINQITPLIKAIIIFSLAYSVLAVFASTNYSFFMDILGNQTTMDYGTQYRASFMIGSSITVSYYLVLTIPICMYFYSCLAVGVWKQISLLTILLNAVAVVLLVSRLAFVTLVFVILCYVLFVRSNKLPISKKILILILSLSGIVYVSNKYDISRLFNAVDDSSEMRFEAMNLGVYLFRENPIIGTGVGAYFDRAYSIAEIVVDGIRGLVDPHNLYILILSETGILGFGIMVSLFLYIFLCFSKIHDKYLKKTAYITVFALLIASMGGSQLWNEPSFAVIFWIYISIFLSQTRIKKS